MKLIIVILITIMSFLFKGEVWASGFNMKSIGEVETGGQQISHWWYTGTQPTFRGEATPNAEVVVDVDGTALQVNADSSGEWVFTPVTALGDGDHTINISSGGSEIKFTLTLGVNSVDWNAVGSGSAETLPTVGTTLPTLFLMMGGLMALVVGGKMVLNANKN